MSLSNFKNLYPLSKTLRFELKPVGKTLEHIEKNGILKQDDDRAESYKKVKKIIDEYHKKFIDDSLAAFETIDENTIFKFEENIKKYDSLYKIGQKDKSQKDAFAKIQNELRKQIATTLTKNEGYKRLFGKELIKEDLKKFIKSKEYVDVLKRKDVPESQFEERIQDDLGLTNDFVQFTTYFTGFNENRENMYSDEDKSTAISHRLINENLPKFIDNISIFEKVSKSAISNDFGSLKSELSEILKNTEIENFFKLDSYSHYLTQKQIDCYNTLIGGIAKKENSIKIKGLNEYINLYNQKQMDRNAKLPKLKPLFKQILSDRNTISWLPEKLKDSNDVLETIEKCYRELCENVFYSQKENEMSLPMLIGSIKDYDLGKIYLKNGASLTDISQKVFGDWDAINRVITVNYESENPQKPKENAEKFNKRKEEYLKSLKSVSIAFVDGCLVKNGASEEKRIENYFASMGTFGAANELSKNLFLEIDKAYNAVKELLNTKYPEDKKLLEDKANIEKIKSLLDAIKKLQWFIKPLLGTGEEPEKDLNFYGEFTRLWQELDRITPLYNMVRNYATQKPYSEEKIKLNFENSTLLDGWDLNKEPDNTSIILRKNGLYYLGIMDKKNNKIFKMDEFNTDSNCFEKMEYKLLPGANKMLPKVFFSKSRIAEFNPCETLIKNYENETHKKGEKFNIKDCHALIDFFKESIKKHEDWKKFGFKFSDTKSYEDLSGFYREVEQQGYKITFRNISESYINQLVEEGKLYLFQIYNKDFSAYSKGTPNMHTLYWKMLFDPENLKNVVYKLNGQAEVFYRKASVKVEKPTHPANEPINNKNDLNEKRQSTFAYDLIKNKRYTENKFQFHVPITMNFKASGMNNMNLNVNQFIQENGVEHIIGIDRGERHLLYLTLIDLKGNVKKQFSLNEIVNEYRNKKDQKTEVRINYHTLLDKKEIERQKARESWQMIENIKELKEGYLSQVIHKITDLMIEYKAIVVLEDLNFGFMRGRQKVEKQVYQKFEKMLIDKLNYLVDKKKKSDELGGVLNAYQLTGKFESFQKLGKQSGFLFYIPAWMTSKMDPTTGFVNLFDTRYENESKAKAFFEKFDSIKYNPDKKWFELNFDYKNFTEKADGSRTKWTLCTYGDRIESFRNEDKNNEWDSREFGLSERFQLFFDLNEIDVNGDIKSQILTKTGKAFWDGLLQILKLTLQMRNSIIGGEKDYLISPVMNAQGEFYDSRKYEKMEDAPLPANADANGAYNIARKGLWVVEQIKKSTDLTKLKLAITNKEWLHFAQNFNDKIISK